MARTGSWCWRASTPSGSARTSCGSGIEPPTPRRTGSRTTHAPTGGPLVRTVVEHNRDKEGQGGRCSVCGVSAPCPVWRRLERANNGIATSILNQYYSLPPATLDERLADGIFTPDDEEDGV